MKTPKEVIQSIFELHEDGKVPVKIALEKVREHLPHISSRGMGLLIKAAFGKSVRRAKPGKSKSNPNPVFKYYGMKLALNQTEFVAPSLPESFGQKCCNSPMLPGIDALIRQLSTPEETKELRIAVTTLARKVKGLTTELQAQKKIKHQRNGEKVAPVTIPPSMLLRREDVQRVGRFLGKGTFGLCRMCIPGIPVAVKEFLNPNKWPSEKLRQSVVAETLTLLSLRACNNLPLLIGVCLAEEPFSLVTQYWGKMTIFNALRDKRLLGCIPWVAVIKEVVEGLSAIHSSHIIHNDLKGMFLPSLFIFEELLIAFLGFIFI